MIVPSQEKRRKKKASGDYDELAGITKAEMKAKKKRTTRKKTATKKVRK